jgi:hypothetical protein
LNYQFDSPHWAGIVLSACFDRFEAFAEEQGDDSLYARYELHVAADLLGRLGRAAADDDKERSELELGVFFGEGIKWMAKVCDHARNQRA